MLTEKQALKYLTDKGLKVSTPQLRRWRTENRGPRFLKNKETGAVRYIEKDLTEWFSKVWGYLR